MKDLRLFLNSVTRSLELMKQGGVDADMEQRETEEALILTISIPKGRTPGDGER
jgi:ParB family chromosome partitioning protein